MHRLEVAICVTYDSPTKAQRLAEALKRRGVNAFFISDPWKLLPEAAVLIDGEEYNLATISNEIRTLIGEIDQEAA